MCCSSGEPMLHRVWHSLNIPLPSPRLDTGRVKHQCALLDVVLGINRLATVGAGLLAKERLGCVLVDLDELIGGLGWGGVRSLSRRPAGVPLRGLLLPSR